MILFMEEAKSKKRAYVDKVLKDNAFKFANEQSLDGYQSGKTRMVYKFFYRKRDGNGILKNSIKNETLANELHRLVIRYERKLVLSSMDNIWGADLADMQVISKFKNVFRIYSEFLKFAANMLSLSL